MNKISQCGVHVTDVDQVLASKIGLLFVVFFESNLVAAVRQRTKLHSRYATYRVVFNVWIFDELAAYLGSVQMILTSNVT